MKNEHFSDEAFSSKELTDGIGRFVSVELTRRARRLAEQIEDFKEAPSMKKEQIKLGHRYAAKISGKIVIVRIDYVSPHGGWMATNQMTNRKVRIKTAARLRYTVGA